MIKREIDYIITALIFFTRIPAPKWYQYQAAYSNPSRKYWPFIGGLVGGIAAAVYSLSIFLFPPSIAVLLSMISSVFVTGAFHEDGFADVCDGFGGGWDKENIIRIMKDSRVGAYALVGLSLLLWLKFQLLVELSHLHYWLVPIILIHAHGSSRLIALFVIYTRNYVQENQVSKVKTVTNTKLSFTSLSYSALFVLFPFFCFKPWLMLASFGCSFISQLALSYYFNKRIGGYTGDCLGAVQQVAEIVFYLSTLALWNYM